MIHCPTWSVRILFSKNSRMWESLTHQYLFIIFASLFFNSYFLCDLCMLITFQWRHFKDSLSLLKEKKRCFKVPLIFFSKNKISKISNDEIPSCHQNPYVVGIPVFSPTKQTWDQTIHWFCLGNETKLRVLELWSKILIISWVNGPDLMPFKYIVTYDKWNLRLSHEKILKLFFVSSLRTDFSSCLTHTQTIFHAASSSIFLRSSFF